MTRRKRKDVLERAVDATNRLYPLPPTNTIPLDMVNVRNAHLRGYLAGWRAAVNA